MRSEDRVKRSKPATREDTRIVAAPSAFDLDQHLFFWFTQVLDRRDRHLAAALKPYSLRAPEWRALASLHSRHALSMSELADLTSIERTTLSRTVERMVRKGWVVRLSDTADMRVTRLAPTSTGEKLFARIWPAVQRLNDAAVAGLPAPVTDMLKWALQQMRRSLDESLSAPPAKRRAA
jgi:DNA-binding MarR family transcriptional regulator